MRDGHRFSVAIPRFVLIPPRKAHSPSYSPLLSGLRLKPAESIENRRFLRVPTAEKLKNLKTDCVCGTSKKPRIAGLSERPDGVSAVGSLSCPLIERANFQLIRQIAGANSAPNGGQRWLSFRYGSYSPPFSQSRTNRFTGGNTAESFVLCKGCGFPAKEMRKAVAGFAGDQPNAMLALSEKERFFSLHLSYR